MVAVGDQLVVTCAVRVRSSKLYASPSSRPVIVAEVAVSPTVPQTCHVELDDSRYRTSYSPLSMVSVQLTVISSSIPLSRLSMLALGSSVVNVTGIY
nr:hypothetical protein [Halorussus salinus]